VRVLDRPWVLGDRVARADDPRSLGTVVSVSCRLTPAVVGGAMETTAPPPQVSVQSTRAVGGFRAEDWVAHEGAHWVGKVEEAVFRVEVVLCSKIDQRKTRGRGRQKHPVCMFQVSSEGLQGLEPVGGEDVTPQELSPHFPGQRVKAPARLWRQAEWLQGGIGRRSPRRGTAICGVVSSVECCLIAVRWMAGAAKDSQPPDEWVAPENLSVLSMPNSSEGWAIGDHIQAPKEWHSPTAVIVESQTVVDVRWADGSVEEGIPSVRLCPRPHISAHDFLPHDFVARSSDGFADAGGMGTAAAPHGLWLSAVTSPGGNTSNQDYNGEQYNMNTDETMYGYPEEGEMAATDYSAEGDMDAAEILPAEVLLPPMPPETPLGIVTSVDVQARTAVVQWISSTSSGGAETMGEAEEVSVFELTDHPQVDIRLSDAVVVAVPNTYGWAGRVSSLRADGKVEVVFPLGISQWIDARRLLVVDDGEGSSSIGAPSEAGTIRSDGPSEILGIIERDSESSDDNLEWGEAHEEPWPELLPEAAQDNESQEETPRSICSTCADLTDRGISPHADMELSRGECSGEAAASSSTLPDTAGSPSAASAEDPSESSALVAFDVCDDDVEPLDHFFLSHVTFGTRQLMMAARREMVVLRKGLLEGQDDAPAPIIVRTFASRSDLFRAMVVGPPGTPYEHVPLFFDLALPPDYPRDPPVAHFHAHYVGNERLNPNLYVDGKVCLSLLGTWSGPAWDPKGSTLLQVLVSLQGLVLVEEPYFNEPGHECDAGTEQGRQSSALYNEHARLLALRAALNVVQNPPLGFKEIVERYFARCGQKLLESCEESLREPKASETSEGFRKVLAKSLLPRMHAMWGSMAAR